MVRTNENIYSARFSRRIVALVDRITTRKRGEMLAMILDAIADDNGPIETALDIGSTKDSDMASSNFFARELAKKYMVTLLADQYIDPEKDLNFEIDRAIIGDATRIGDDIGTFDLVIASATVEHVGNLANQARMVASCIRLANRYAVITTPNRWHPLEFHTHIPLLHWLPKPLHRRLLRAIGFSFFADEDNLNLLDRAALERMVADNPVRHLIEEWRISTVRLFGFVSNLVLIVKIRPPAPTRP